VCLVLVCVCVCVHPSTSLFKGVQNIVLEKFTKKNCNRFPTNRQIYVKKGLSSIPKTRILVPRAITCSRMKIRVVSAGTTWKRTPGRSGAIASEVLRLALCAHHLQKRLLKRCSAISGLRLCCQSSLSYSLECEPFRNECQLHKRQRLFSINSQCVAKPYVRLFPLIPSAFRQGVANRLTRGLRGPPVVQCGLQLFPRLFPATIELVYDTLPTGDVFPLIQPTSCCPHRMPPGSPSSVRSLPSLQIARLGIHCYVRWC